MARGPKAVARAPSESAARLRRIRLRIAAACVALLALSWNAIAVIGTDGDAKELANPAAGNARGGSVDLTAPVTTRQS